MINRDGVDGASILLLTLPCAGNIRYTGLPSETDVIYLMYSSRM